MIFDSFDLIKNAFTNNLHRQSKPLRALPLSSTSAGSTARWSVVEKMQLTGKRSMKYALRLRTYFVGVHKLPVFQLAKKFPTLKWT